MNVEQRISMVSGIKFHFKYTCKRSYKVDFQLKRADQHEMYDKLSTFQDATYTSASKAVWWILKIDMIQNYSLVARLDNHLEDHHTIYLNEEGRVSEAAAARALWRGRPGTKFLSSYEPT